MSRVGGVHTVEQHDQSAELTTAELTDLEVRRPLFTAVAAELPRSTHRCDTGSVGVSDSCTICLEDYEDGVKLVNLPCGHAFHIRCIYNWMDSSMTCPNCRRVLYNEQVRAGVVVEREWSRAIYAGEEDPEAINEHVEQIVQASRVLMSLAWDGRTEMPTPALHLRAVLEETDSDAQEQ